MSITNKIEELLKSYDVDYEKEYFKEDDTYEFRFVIGKKGIIVTHDKVKDKEEDCDGFMGGFDNEMGVASNLPLYRCMEDALLHMAIKIKEKIKETHYKGMQ